MATRKAREAEPKALQSAVLLEDPDAIFEALEAAHAALVAERGERSPAATQTEIARDADGRPRARKRGALLARGAKAVSASDVERLATMRGIQWQPAFADRALAYWASDERVDGHGDVVRQAWDFADFEANPVMPYSHQWDAPPVGNAIDWQVTTREDGGYKGPALWLLGLFATAETWDWAGTVFNLAKAGFLRGGSVGFVPLKVTRIEDQTEREALGLPPWGLIYERSSLVEFSPTTLPANQGALTILNSLRSSGSLRAADVQVVRDLARHSIPRGRGDKTAWQQRDAEIVAAARLLFPAERFPERADLDATPDAPAPELRARAEEPEPKGSIEERLDRIESLLETSLVSLSARVEELRSDLAATAKAEAAQDDPDDLAWLMPEVESVRAARAERLSKALDNL